MVLAKNIMMALSSSQRMTIKLVVNVAICKNLFKSVISLTLIGHHWRQRRRVREALLAVLRGGKSVTWVTLYHPI